MGREAYGPTHSRSLPAQLAACLEEQHRWLRRRKPLQPIRIERRFLHGQWVDVKVYPCPRLVDITG